MPDMDYGLGPWTLWNCGISHLDIISSIKIRLAGLINKKQKQKLDRQSDAFSKQISFWYCSFSIFWCDSGQHSEDRYL